MSNTPNMFQARIMKSKNITRKHVNKHRKIIRINSRGENKINKSMVKCLHNYNDGEFYLLTAVKRYSGNPTASNRFLQAPL